MIERKAGILESEVDIFQKTTSYTERFRSICLSAVENDPTFERMLQMKFTMLQITQC